MSEEEKIVMEENKLSSQKKEPTSLQVLKFAFFVCLFTSIIVSFVAVLLKERQDENKVLDKQKNILIAAGLIDEGEKIDKQRMQDLFSNVKIQAINLDTGEVDVTVDLVGYDQYRASKNIDFSRVLRKGVDLALIKRRENVGLVYHVFNDAGELQRFIIPIRGYGLWSTLHGFLALSVDASTVEGVTFYEHAETPGLGGEVDNPNWKALWPGKTVYNKEGEIIVRVVKGQAKKDSKTEIDGLSGATLTSRGVDNMIRFWLGSNGYGNYIKKNFLSRK